MVYYAQSTCTYFGVQTPMELELLLVSDIYVTYAVKNLLLRCAEGNGIPP